MLFRISILLSVYFLLTAIPLVAQTSYQINNYTPRELQSGNQNWDITSDGHHRIFVANNYGLLVLENANTRLYESPSQTILRSVAWINGRVYTGSFEEFGYWEPDENSNLVYTSLVPLLEDPSMRNDEIWRIIHHNGTIYFHSFGSIYAYDGASVNRVEKPGSVMFLHKVGDQVYTQQIGGPLLELINDTFVPIEKSEFLSSEEVKAIVQLPDGSRLIGTSMGLHIWSSGEFSIWNVQNYDQLIASQINSMVIIGEQLVVGTILTGIYVYDLSGNLIKNINTQHSLQNNTILSIYPDSEGNIWVGMDKGIDYIDLSSALISYRDPNLGLGSVYTAVLFQNELYVGTNQGIYWYERDSNGSFVNQTLISASQGQVWFIQEIDGQLYAGLNDGTYLIRNKELERVSIVDGGYTMKPWPASSTPAYLQSTYNNLVVYQQQENVWRQSYNLENFFMPARYLEIDHLGNIWLGHSVKGIYQLKPDRELRSISQVIKVDSSMGVDANTNQLFKLDNRIMIPHNDELMQFDPLNNNFIPYTDLDSYFTISGEISAITQAGPHRYWVVKKQEILLFEIHFDSIELLYRLLPDMFGFGLIEGYENIIRLDENLHLIGLDDGFAILDLEIMSQDRSDSTSLFLSQIDVVNDRGSVSRLDLTQNEHSLPWHENSVTFSWTTDQMVGNRTFFQYKLDGIDEIWSSWTSPSSVSYLRLPPGDYKFYLRSIAPDGQLTEMVPFNFVIRKPWYITPGAFFVYFVLVVSFLLMIRIYISRRRWRKISKDLEVSHEKMLIEKELNEKEIIKLTNDKLQAEVEHKSAQLATNTMAILRKNELLQSIKTELLKQKSEMGDRLPKKYANQLLSLIDKGLQDEREWEVFEQLYDQAHGDFFKRLKDDYPQLTPSDLRLCAYLRMNLASKEIAPLLSISVRGVEERRYRLRKRLNLSADTNLTEMIMTY
ncbi:MAG TPA: hypothetical protein DCE78_01715 [Bacteroidetes bacterium]|nr:hypothetical protein [Bacteroidota bacterium]